MTVAIVLLHSCFSLAGVLSLVTISGLTIKHGANLNEWHLVGNMDNLVEQLAALEHSQWQHWSQKVVERYGCLLPEFMVEKWQKLWVPYEELTDDVKEFDREW